MAVRLFVKDNSDGTVHEYGDNPHDSLELNEDGSLYYVNLQNCASTRYPKEGYSFCDKNGNTDFECPETGEEIYDIGGYETPDWKPVDEKKPREGVDVYATVRTREIDLTRYDGITVVEENSVMIVRRVIMRDPRGFIDRDFYVMDSGGVLPINSRVIAWMPLPKAYQEEQS